MKAGARLSLNRSGMALRRENFLIAWWKSMKYTVPMPIGRKPCMEKRPVKGFLAPIPDFDFFIAAIAIASGATLITRDRHFKDIPGLKVELL